MIELDGSFGEGGGALVRTALALSTVTNQPFVVHNIRAGRSKPGLKAQHLAAIDILTQICSATTNEIQIGSTELTYTPSKVRRGKYEIDIGTAGSISLVLQAVLLPCLFSPGKITITIVGGTCGKWQAGVDFMQNVFVPQIEQFVEKMTLRITKRGYYPKGGGEIVVEVWPRFSVTDFAALQEELTLHKPLMLHKQGKIQAIKGIVNVSSELIYGEVAERIALSATKSLSSLEVPVKIETTYARSLSVGGEVLVYGLFDNQTRISADQLIEKGMPAEKIGVEVARKLKCSLLTNAGVDEHLSDMMIPFMGLFPGSKMSVPHVTNHLKTNIYVVEKFLPVKFVIEDNVVKSESTKNTA